MNPIIATSLLGGILAVDYRSSLRLMVSQPLCGGTLTGLILGAPLEGLLAGSLLQIIFLGNITVRGERVLALPVAGVAMAALYILCGREAGGDVSARGVILFWSLLFAIFTAGVGQVAYRVWENRSNVLVEKAFEFARRGRLRLASTIHLSMLLVHFIYGCAALLLVISLGRAFIVSVALRAGFPAAGSPGVFLILLPFLGVGSLVRLHLAKSQAFWFGAGFLLTVVLFLFNGG
ncbi:MAG: PTS sugar transporter subunit IIC [Candidatus Krumholzibacteriota bacterium]|nr:PTS sugar transporter subunit IIC [Candidatus Krumholzibacteriota bacterium]